MQLRIPLNDLYAAPGFLDPVGDAAPMLDAARVATLYSFIPPSTTFSLTDDALLIGVPDPEKKRLVEANDLFERASKRAREGDHEKAIQQYERGLAIAVLHIDARRNLAMARMARGDTTGADAELRRLLLLVPADSWSWVILGNLNFRQNFALAERYFRRAVELSPHDPYAWNGMGAMYIEKQDYQKAVAAFESAIAANPKFPNAYLGLARALAEQGELRSAFEALERMYATSVVQDARSLPMIEHAGGFYRDLAMRLATATMEAAEAEVESLAAEVERVSGFSVQFEDGDLGVQMPDSRFRDHVIASLVFPLPMNDVVIADAGHINEVHFSEAKTIDGLDELLAKGDPAAVLSWLAHDGRGLKWKFPSIEHGKFGNRPHRASTVRYFSGPIPSYVRWRLQSTAWLPLRLGRLARPQDCVAETAGGLEDLLPVPSRPDPEKLARYDLPPVLIRDAFDRAGVIPGFSQLEPEQLYSLLLELPQREGEQKGRWARSVYRAILDHFDASDVAGSPARNRFLRTGQMWARSLNGEQYFPVNQLWHVDSEDIPSALLKDLNVVSLPKRSGSQKVAALFGVRSVERSQITRKIQDFQLVVGADRFADEIERLKPLLLLLRRTKTQSSKLFRSLRVQICISIAGEMEFQGHRSSLELCPWDWILDDETQTAYVQSDPSEPDPLRSDLMADAVGQIFAAVFRIERGDEFARLIGCKAKDRTKILRRLVGEEKLPELAEIERNYAEATAGEVHELQVPPEALQPPIFVQPPHTNTPGSAVQDAAEQPKNGPSQPPQIDPQPHAVIPGTVGIDCRVTRKQSVGPRTFSGTRRVTDWVFCEYKAVEFEEAAERFPLRVSAVTGWKAPGVDVISFATAEDRSRFVAAENKDDTQIIRLIEVKGTSSGNTRIDLRGNELAAAQRNRGRYYLYSVFDKHDDTYEMAILRDPLGDAKGVRSVIEINLELADGTEEYRITGGIHENSYRLGAISMS